MQITGCFNSIWTYFYPEKSTDLKGLLKNYQPSYFPFCEPSLNLELRSVQAIELKTAIEEVLTDLIHEDNLQDIFSTIENLAPALPLEGLFNAKNILTDAQNMVREAKLYLSYHQSSYLPSLYNLYVQIVDALALVFDTLFSIFGIRELFTPVENESEGFSRHQKMILLFNLSSVLTSLIISLQLSTSFGVLAIAGTFLFIGLLNLVWPHIKPMPSQLPGNIRNFTQELRNQNPYVVVRKSTLDEIVNLIQRNIHPILVGPSQIGKTRTAEALAYSLCYEEYPEFNHHRVFYANATELTGQTSLTQGQNTIFKRIKEISGRHFRSLFLILDECHMLCKNKERTGELIKTLLDENAPFPFIIGITTLEEYKAHIKPNIAFSNRFKPVYITNTTEDETVKILGATLIKLPSKPMIEPGVLRYIYKKSCDEKDEDEVPLSQPAAALSLLKKCVQYTEKNHRFPCEKEIETLSTQIEALNAESALTLGHNQAAREKMAELEKGLNPKLEELDELQSKKSRLFKMRECLNQVTLKIYQLSLKITHHKNLIEIKRFILLNHILRPLLEKHLKEKSSEYNIPMEINQALVDQIQKLTSSVSQA